MMKCSGLKFEMSKVQGFRVSKFPSFETSEDVTNTQKQKRNASFRKQIMVPVFAQQAVLFRYRVPNAISPQMADGGHC